MNNVCALIAVWLNGSQRSKDRVQLYTSGRD